MGVGGEDGEVEAGGVGGVLGEGEGVGGGDDEDLVCWSEGVEGEDEDGVVKDPGGDGGVAGGELRGGPGGEVVDESGGWGCCGGVGEVEVLG